MDKPICNNDLAKLLLRLAVGGLMLLHGLDKAHEGGLAFIERLLRDRGWPEFIAYGVYVGEILAPILILVGFWSRLGGLVLAVTMVMTIVLASPGDWYTLNMHGALMTELNMLYMVGGLAIFFGGGGRYALGTGLGRWS